MAEDGFPVAPVSASAWASGYAQLRNSANGDEMLLDGRPPLAGQILQLPTLANTFRELASKGKAGFYEGRVAQAIVDVVTQLGGVMSLEDLKNHISTFEDPIHVNYRGVDVYEIPPNGQGITALMALNFLKGFDVSGLKYHSKEHLHLLIESLRFAFADAR
jgi:gamma-glutamyltranspeptidase / glutathione hydrolase